MLLLLATLTVHPDRVDVFHDYERRAAKIMRKHGGRIERVVALEPDPEDRYYREFHLVSFPDGAALAAYRDDANSGPWPRCGNHASSPRRSGTEARRWTITKNNGDEPVAGMPLPDAL